MVREFIPSYDEYRAILARIKATGKLMSYGKAAHRAEFIVLRHDVEFSIEKAVEMAEVESDCGVRSTYFIQLESPAYNALSEVSIRQIKRLSELGHAIGLHYREDCSLPKQANEYRIWKQLSTLLNATGIKIATFSTHMPSESTEYHRYAVKEAINAYAQPYFHRFGEAGPDVLYISDSELRWNYGYPDDRTLNDNLRVQILIHPYGWGRTPRAAAEVFADLRREKALCHEGLFAKEFPDYQRLEKGE